jgi:hypothetical protein
VAIAGEAQADAATNMTDTQREIFERFIVASYSLGGAAPRFLPVKTGTQKHYRGISKGYF